MLNFLPGSGVFALAGLVAAAGPILIHLLNRRRFRVVNWAAMDFLLEALQRNRKMLQLRDLLLLALRTACVLLFGLALARPYFSNTDAKVESNQPLHAILIVDNSMSMGYEALGGTLLDEARQKARDFIGELPEGSRISILPLCGSATGFSRDAYRTKEDAREALSKIEVVDRTGTAAQAADLALEAKDTVPDMPAKRVVFLGDQQVINWPAESLSAQLKDLPEMQVVSIAPQASENTWISDFTLQDGIADVETPAVFSATVRHEGSQPRSNVQVTLSVDGTEVGSETIDLEPDQSREVTFQYRFDVAAEAGKPVFVPAQVSIPQDHLKQDDSRVLSVPVVAALPVVFVDQYGPDEDAKKNHYGETRHLRRLLSPVTQRGDTNRQLVQIQHKRIDQLDRPTLEDARVVVIAGVASPEGAVPLLRDFVKQGGQLVIAAGADFDVAAWNQAAWLDGAGVLPTPLKGLVGKLPEESPEAKPFYLSYKSMAHDYFHLAGVSNEELQDLYGLPVFFKAVEAEVDAGLTDSLVAAESKRIEAQRGVLAKADEQRKLWTEKEAKGTLSDEDRSAKAREQEELLAIAPNWLLWTSQQQNLATTDDADLKPGDLAERTRPRMLAAFDNGLPFLIERNIGRGRVLFVSSGTFSSWNTLPKTNTILLFDRILREMLENTLPQRNLDSVEQETIPVTDRYAAYELSRPDGTRELLTVDALGADVYGVTVRNATSRGIYKVTARKPDQSAEHEGLETKIWEVPLAVNGPSNESQLAVLDQAGLKTRMGDASYRWIGRGETISLEGSQVRGQDLWKWLIGLVIVCLLAELLVLARPVLARERAA